MPSVVVKFRNGKTSIREVFRITKTNDGYRGLIHVSPLNSWGSKSDGMAKVSGTVQEIDVWSDDGVNWEPKELEF